MRIMPLFYINTNDRLGEDITNTKGDIVLEKGSTLTKEHKKELIDLGFYSAFIQDQHSDELPTPPISDDLIRSYFETIKNAFQKTRLLLTHHDNDHTKIQDDRLATEHAESIESLIKMTDNVLEALRSFEAPRTNFLQIKNVHDYPYQHAMSTSLLSALMGLRIGCTPEDIHSMMLASIFIEMANLTVPHNILHKRDQLTKDEFKIVKKHCYACANILGNLSMISENISKICLQHHEHLDGTGYPEGLKDSEIEILAKIITVADSYDALTSDRIYRMFNPPLDALNYLEKMSGVHFDENVVATLRSLIQPFNVGTIVTLSDNRDAVIIETNDINPLKPTLTILPTTKHHEPINLNEVDDISISGIKHLI